MTRATIIAAAWFSSQVRARTHCRSRSRLAPAARAHLDTSPAARTACRAKVPRTPYRSRRTARARGVDLVWVVLPPERATVAVVKVLVFHCIDSYCLFEE